MRSIVCLAALLTALAVPTAALGQQRSDGRLTVAQAKGPPGQNVTLPLISGMTVRTANVVDNVQIRAKSYGPGFCAISVSSTFGSVNFLAPPLVWSNWATLFSHINSVATTVSTSAECDTGALFEIRYTR